MRNHPNTDEKQIEEAISLALKQAPFKKCGAQSIAKIIPLHLGMMKKLMKF